MRILFLSSWFPFPPTNGAKIRIYNLIKTLSTRHEVTLVSLARTYSVDEARAQIPHLEQYCRRVNVVAANPFLPYSPRAFAAFLSPKPRSIVQTYNKEMEELVTTHLTSRSYDMVIASEVSAPSEVSLLVSKIDGIPIVLDCIEVDLAKDAYLKQVSHIGRLRKLLTWYKQKRFTRQLVLSVDACTVPSSQERRNIMDIVPEHPLVEVVPHCLDLAHFNGNFGLPIPRTMVFTGSLTYFANLDAVSFFLQEIHPHIRENFANVSVKVIGSTKGVASDKLKTDSSVEFAGFLEDVRPVVAQSWLSIVPLRIGAGTRLKIIESMALGTPVVSTSKGAEGLNVSDGENILIADHPRDFAYAVLELMRNAKLREKLSTNGRRLVEEKYSSEVVGRIFLALLDRVSISN